MKTSKSLSLCFFLVPTLQRGNAYLFSYKFIRITIFLSLRGAKRRGNLKLKKQTLIYNIKMHIMCFMRDWSNQKNQNFWHLSFASLHFLKILYKVVNKINHLLQ